MRTSLAVGTSPVSEDCVQVTNTKPYLKEMREEARRYQAALIKVYGEPPAGAFLKIVEHNHDFGPYLEVEVFYDDEDEKQEEYALTLEGGLDTWAEADMKKDTATMEQRDTEYITDLMKELCMDEDSE